MLTANKKIAIIGGGPGGLTLARLLQLKGATVTVYERDICEEARVQGATLDLHYNSGLLAIKKAGLSEAFKENYRPGAEKGRVIDKHGNILFDEHITPGTDDFENEYARPEIDRADLRNMLLASLQPGTVLWNKQFAGMFPMGNQWRLEFKDGSSSIADIVIGADGANSKIRPYITTVKPSYAGIIILQGNVPDAANKIPEIHQLLLGGKIYVYAEEKFLHISAKGDGSIDFYISMKKAEDWQMEFSDRTLACSWFKNEFSSWSPIWFSLMEHTDLPLLLRAQYIMSSDEAPEALSNLTLLGDAAHIMPPSGEGVNLAMLDALELSECLTGSAFNDIQSALAVYEKDMRQRAKEEAKVAMEMMEWMHGENALQTFLKLYCATAV